jgi:hypothetical protein
MPVVPRVLCINCYISVFVYYFRYLSTKAYDVISQKTVIDLHSQGCEKLKFNIWSTSNPALGRHAYTTNRI